MKIRSLLKILGAIVLAFPAIAMVSALLFDGGGFRQRFLSGFLVMTTLGFDTPVSVPHLLGLILSIAGHVLSIGIHVIVGLILLKLVVRVVVSEKRTTERKLQRSPEVTTKEIQNRTSRGR